MVFGFISDTKGICDKGGLVSTSPTTLKSPGKNEDGLE